MSTTDTYAPAAMRRDIRGPSWLLRGIDWLDDRGFWAWVGLAVTGFVVSPPVGIVIVAYMIWSKRMFGHRQDTHGRAVACGHRRAQMDAWRNARTAMRPSGNAAFDAYKAETLRRLEDEQRAFEEFLGRLREAKDKAEFDQFMEDRARRAADRTPDGDDHDQAA